MVIYISKYATPQKYFFGTRHFIWQNNGRKQEMKYVFLHQTQVI
jgi:hypothetical protein